MSAQPKRLLTPEEYLAIERDVPQKHEFYRGEMFAMGGASTEHNQITFNLAGALHAHLKGRNCAAYVNDMRVKVSATGLYVYPDVVVTCEKPRFEDVVLDTLLNPQIIIEVASDSTEIYDRTKKFTHYQRIESLKEYVLVTQKWAHIDRFIPGDDGTWMLNSEDGVDGVLELTTIGCRLKLAEIYDKVEFPPVEEINRAAGIYGPDSPR